jgi:hypothetical protein
MHFGRDAFLFFAAFCFLFSSPSAPFAFFANATWGSNIAGDHGCQFSSKRVLPHF